MHNLYRYLHTDFPFWWEQLPALSNNNKGEQLLQLCTPLRCLDHVACVQHGLQLQCPLVAVAALANLGLQATHPLFHLFLLCVSLLGCSRGRVNCFCITPAPGSPLEFQQDLWSVPNALKLTTMLVLLHGTNIRVRGNQDPERCVRVDGFQTKRTIMHQLRYLRCLSLGSQRNKCNCHVHCIAITIVVQLRP